MIRNLEKSIKLPSNNYIYYTTVETRIHILLYLKNLTQEMSPH